MLKSLRFQRHLGRQHFFSKIITMDYVWQGKNINDAGWILFGLSLENLVLIC